MFVRNCLIFVIVNFFMGPVSSEKTKFGYEYYQRVNGWLRLHTVPATWFDARLRCQLEGGTVASPTSPALVEAMTTMMAENYHYGQTHKVVYNVYTGINALIAKGDYATIEGVPLTNITMNWAIGEPDNYDNSEDCLVMNGAGELADVNCSRVFSYFCYKDNAKMQPNNCRTWDSDYQLEPRTGSCYKFQTTPRNWHHAALACRAENAHLAVINSDNEADVLKELFAKHPANTIIQGEREMVFIGFWDWLKQGEWQTIFGQTLVEAGFGRWSDNEPSNHMNSEFCGTMYRNGRLNDFSCDARIVSICEINL